MAIQVNKYVKWEIDWNRRRRRNGRPEVWARNPESIRPSARKWHWTAYVTVTNRGIQWIDQNPRRNRYTSRSKGYVIVTKNGMTPERMAIADRFNLWIGKNARRYKWGVWEHQIVAAEKYGTLPERFLIRHLNGDKTDNRPENLLLGTDKDNRRDHRDAVVEMMYWRERCLRAEHKNVARSLIAGVRAGMSCS